MDFSHDYLVHYYEADPARRLKLSSLVQYFEDIAILHSKNCGYDLEFFDANHCGWMLLKWDISIRSLPSFGTKITVGTGVHAMKRFLADRAFVMTASDGSVLAEGRSNWLLVDTGKRRPIRVPEEQYRSFNVTKETEADFISIDDVPSVPESASEPGFDFFRRAIVAGNTDIDTNRHVNNVCYVNWALDSLPRDFADTHTAVHLSVQYRKEIGLGTAAEVVSAVAKDSAPSVVQTTRHTIRALGEECCSISIGWK